MVPPRYPGIRLKLSETGATQGSACYARRPRAQSRPMTPETHYARNEGVNIAYQVVGRGDVDLVFVPGWVSHIEYAWEEPSFAPFLERMSRFSRLICMDRRGTGLSDPVGR